MRYDVLTLAEFLYKVRARLLRVFTWVVGANILLFIASLGGIYWAAFNGFETTLHKGVLFGSVWALALVMVTSFVLAFAWARRNDEPNGSNQMLGRYRIGWLLDINELNLYAVFVLFLLMAVIGLVLFMY